MTLKSPIEFRTAFSQYVATEIIGEDGSARVYKATDDAGQSFAIKLLDPAKATKDKVKRFKNEYQFCAKNSHQNIVPVLDYGLVDDGDGRTPFFVMPLYGCSLRILLNATIPPNDVLVLQRRFIK